jgi:fucose 4-O-acetylase-like acetyltransferase
MKEKRIDSIDIFRGIGIIIMIMGHMNFGELFGHWIHAFHMPMFYFISGMFFDRNKEMKITIGFYVYKKIKTLLVPYVFFSMLHYGIWLHNNWELEISVKLIPLKNIFWVNTGYIPIAGALWFLTSLFLTEIIYLVLTRYISDKRIMTIVVAIIAIAGNLEIKILGFQLPYAIGSAFVGVGLLHIGQMFWTNKEKMIVGKILNLPIVATCLCGIMISFLIFINGEINMRLGEYCIIPLFWINAIVSIIVGINISCWLDKRIPHIFKNIFIYIGKNSIIYLCLNQLVISYIYKFLTDSIINNVLWLIIIILLLTVISLIINKTFLKKVIGKD